MISNERQHITTTERTQNAVNFESKRDFTYLDLRLVSSCWMAWILDGACFSYVTFSMPDELVSVTLVLVPWKPADEITPPLMF